MAKIVVRVGEASFTLRHGEDRMSHQEASENYLESEKFSKAVEKFYPEPKENFIFRSQVDAALEGRTLNREEAEELWEEEPAAPKLSPNPTVRKVDRAFAKLLQR